MLDPVSPYAVAAQNEGARTRRLMAGGGPPTSAASLALGGVETGCVLLVPLERAVLRSAAGSPVPVKTTDAVTEAGQSVYGRKRTTRKTSLAAGETDRSGDEETKLTQWREKLYFVLSGGGAALRATRVRCISAVCGGSGRRHLAPPQERRSSRGTIHLSQSRSLRLLRIAPS